MGASCNIKNESPYDIYISYDNTQKNNKYLLNLLINLNIRNYNIITSDIVFDLDTVSELETTYNNDISQNFQYILKNSKLFIICISKETFMSYYQTIDINNSLKYKNKLYLIMDKSVLPLNDNFSNNLIKNNNWFSLYTNENISDCLNYIQTRPWLNNIHN